MAYTNSPLELAKCIDGMSYTGLLKVAHELVAMNSEDPTVKRDVTTPHGFADTLADWAESMVLEDEEAKRITKLNAAKSA